MEECSGVEAKTTVILSSEVSATHTPGDLDKHNSKGTEPLNNPGESSRHAQDSTQNEMEVEDARRDICSVQQAQACEKEYSENRGIINESATLDQSPGSSKRRRRRRGKRKNKADVSQTPDDCTIKDNTCTDDATVSVPELKANRNVLDEQTTVASELNISEVEASQETKANNMDQLSTDNVNVSSGSVINVSPDGSAGSKSKNKKRRKKKAQTDPSCKTSASNDQQDTQVGNKGRTPKSGKNKPQKEPDCGSQHEAFPFPIAMVPTRNPLTPPKQKQPSSSAREKTARRTSGRDNSTPSKSSPRSARKKYKPYEEHWTPELVSAGLKRGLLVKGVMRISQRNYEMAWVGVHGIKRDIVIDGMLARNRALQGDVVALQILSRQEWKIDQEQYDSALLEEEIARNKQSGKENSTNEKVVECLASLTLDEEKPPNLEDVPFSPSPEETQFLSEMKEIPDKFLQQTAKVVYILEKKHSRVAGGRLKLFTKNSDDKDALFMPSDSRIPRIRIPHEHCPPGFFDRPGDCENTLFIARITSWPTTAPLDSFYAIGTIARSLGEAGEIEPETDAILMEYAIDSGPFPDEVLSCLPQTLPWIIPEGELAIRRDFRDECVFTIDPMTARDLDDALHCKELADGTYEVGVHIADVSYFVRAGTALDDIALQRGTSTYMVQKVIPMLPRMLCEELCSLNPGEDRLCMSVVWKMTGKGEILDEWKGRGVIRSRVKMAYEHAQEMIEKPSKKWMQNELPPVSDGADIAAISTSVNRLHKMAICMRRKRTENGALRLDQVKLRFDLDKETGLPNGYHVHQQRDSNRLIEEFMLLANMAVAHHIYNAFPITAVLRRHPPPHQKQLDDLVELCKSLGVNFSCNSSKAIQESLAQFAVASPEHEILVNLTMKPMKNAEYFCAGSVEDTAYAHYALSVPLYTHFTSPIRRYPDVLVHRLLAASLAIDEQVDKTVEDLDMITTHCNDRRQAAKTCGELSSEMFFGIFVRECGPLEEDGIVTGVMDQSFDVLVPKLGVTKRIYAKFCPGVKNYEFIKSVKNCPTQMQLTWSIEGNKGQKPCELIQNVRIFTRVKLILTTESELQGPAKPFRVFAKLMPPKQVADDDHELQSMEQDSNMGVGGQIHVPPLPPAPGDDVDVQSSSVASSRCEEASSDQVEKQLFVSEDVMVREHAEYSHDMQMDPATEVPSDGDDVIVETESEEEK